MSFGTGPWGSPGPYGGPSSTTLFISDSIAVNTHTVVVALSAAPMDTHPLLQGDVRNPKTWKVSRLDTGQYFNVVFVDDYDAPLQWALTVLEPLPPFTTFLRVESDSLKDLGGSVLDTPRSSDLVGLIDVAYSSPQNISSTRRFAVRDIANPPSPDVLGALSGTLIIGADGDYQNDEGSDLIKKLIIRRLTTQKGAFSHLPNYGEGFAVKQPMPAGDLVSFQSRLERSIRSEPEVKDAFVSLVQDAGSIVIVVKASLFPSGQLVTAEYQVPFSVEL